MGQMWERIKNELRKSPHSLIKAYDIQRECSYDEFVSEIEDACSSSYAQFLKGAKCAILCRSSFETLKALMICWRLGMVAIPLSLNYGKNHYGKIIEFTRPDLIISDDKHIGVGCTVPIGIIENNKLILPPDLKIHKEEELNNVVIMLCTSGTTGMPKASMFSSDAILTNAELIKDYFILDDSDTMLIVRPLYHCATLVGELLISLMAGANIVLSSGRFSPIEIASILSEEPITVMCGTPTIFKGIIDFLIHRKMHVSLRMIALSGEYLIKRYADDIRNYFSGARIFNVYGMTEAGPRISYLPYELFSEIPESVGKPLRGIEIKIKSSHDGIDEEGGKGEIWVKTPTAMLGYYRDINLTSEHFEGEWLKTGDIGFLDERKNLYILGRSDDMIIKAGMNIYPQELENIFMQMKEVKQVIVFGELQRGITQIVVKIVLKDGFELVKNSDILAKLSDIAPAYMMPSRIEIVDDIPQNASGKVIRSVNCIRDLKSKNSI